MKEREGGRREGEGREAKRGGVEVGEGDVRRGEGERREARRGGGWGEGKEM